MVSELWLSMSTFVMINGSRYWVYEVESPTDEEEEDEDDEDDDDE